MVMLHHLPITTTVVDIMEVDTMEEDTTPTESDATVAQVPENAPLAAVPD